MMHGRRVRPRSGEAARINSLCCRRGENRVCRVVLHTVRASKEYMSERIKPDECYHAVLGARLTLLRTKIPMGSRFPVIAALTFFMVAALADGALAHDCWLQPQYFRFPEGAVLLVHLFLGHAFKVEKELRLDLSMTERFDLITAHETTELLSVVKDGARPVLEVLPGFQGQAIVSMARGFSTVTLPDKVFSRYLEEEHLHDASILRELLGGKDEETERCARYLKCLVQVGEGLEDALHRRRVGHRLELVLLDSLLDVRKAGRMRVKVIFDGAPLDNRVVTAYSRNSQGVVFTRCSRTDIQGVAAFPVQGGGPWLLKMVHLMPCSFCEGIDWESHWTAFSFFVD